ncbi:MAG: histidine kinase [Bryobacterales bacterium]|nr:histidine kinase [Bryobacterales bacterium]
MHEVLTVHEPLLVNTLGHCAGTLIFAIFLYLLLRDRAGAKLRGSRLTITATALALLWNFASLLVIAWNDPASPVSQALVTLSTSALSVLPSVLLHLSLGGSFAWIRRAGYALAAFTVASHASEAVLNAPENHTLALRVTTLGFGALTLIAAIALLTGPGERKRLTSRLVGTMSLFLFSISFVHLGAATPGSWPGELLVHHAGIALALFVLLQDYRFLLVDAFVRFLVNIFFAAVFVFACVSVVNVRTVMRWGEQSPFHEGMLLAAACLLLLLFAVLRARLSQFLVHLVFPRNNLDALLLELRSRAVTAAEEASLMEWAEQAAARLFGASAVRVSEEPIAKTAGAIPLPAPVSDLPGPAREKLEQLGAEAILPLRPSGESERAIFLGRRHGGRRYLSEDFAAMARIQAELVEQIDRHRETEMRRLVTQAELRALQSQIHPHFLFNALNTLYGIIPREAAGARRTVLNLADIFRYFLDTEHQFIRLEEELEIVRAYLEIEALRLGDKLRTEIDASPEALRVSIPVLTIEPLVENAVKHGVAQNTEGGLVRVEAHLEDHGLRIRVLDTGAGFAASSSHGSGHGLENVNKRLRLCYGADAEVHIHSTGNGTEVEFLVPVRQLETVLQ